MENPFGRSSEGVQGEAGKRKSCAARTGPVFPLDACELFVKFAAKLVAIRAE